MRISIEQAAEEQAAEQLDELIDRTLVGEQITLTQDGQPIVDLIAHDTNKMPDESQ